jgi:hypothetical protein
MGINTIGRISQRQLRTLEEALEAAHGDGEDSWKDEKRRSAAARDLRRIVRLCLRIPETLNDLVDSSIDHLMAHLIDDREETAREVREEFNRGQRILTRVIELIEKFAAHGDSIQGTDELRDASERAKRREAEFFDFWPRPLTAEEFVEAQEAIQRGEGIELDEAFAQIAGVDRETWLRRVEERKRARKA